MRVSSPLVLAHLSSQQVYGPDTEVLVMTEDAQPLEEPIIAPVRSPCKLRRLALQACGFPAFLVCMSGVRSCERLLLRPCRSSRGITK